MWCNILFSIILPITNSPENIASLLVDLWQHQPVKFEVVLVSPKPVQIDSPNPALAVQTVLCADPTRGTQLNTGAAAAAGDILLFLWPDNRLPVEALLTIQKNFSLLPQTVGGNFHVKFDDESIAANVAAHVIKKERYKGRYLGNSGIFVTKTEFEALGRFSPLNILEDYEFGLRLEKRGPTLYLPDKIITTLQPYRTHKFLAAWRWLWIMLLLKLGVSPQKLAGFFAEKVTIQAY